MALGSVPASRPRGTRSRRNVNTLGPPRQVWVLVHAGSPGLMTQPRPAHRGPQLCSGKRRGRRAEARTSWAGHAAGPGGTRAPRTAHASSCLPARGAQQRPAPPVSRTRGTGQATPPGFPPPSQNPTPNPLQAPSPRILGDADSRFHVAPPHSPDRPETIPTSSPCSEPWASGTPLAVHTPPSRQAPASTPLATALLRGVLPRVHGARHRLTVGY